MKIAVITQEDHSAIGGIEKVNRKIYELFGEEHQIVEFPTLEDPRYRSKKVAPLLPNIKVDNRLLGWKPYVFIWGGSYSRKNFRYLNENFDMVIVASSNCPKRWVKHPKFYLWQHNNWDFYGIGGKPLSWSIGQAFTSIFFGAGSFRSMFKWSANSVFFVPETSIPTNGRSFYVPLASYSKKDILSKNLKREGFVWFARLENKEKGVKSMVKLANMQPDLTIYGGGKDEKYLSKHLENQSKFKGYIENKNVPSMLQRKKAMVMTSNFEGFPVTIVESLSQGTPVVIFDTFDSAKYFEKSGAVFLFKKGDVESMNKKLVELKNMSAKDFEIISKKAIKFAKDNLSLENFKKNVQNLLDSVQTNN